MLPLTVLAGSVLGLYLLAADRLGGDDEGEQGAASPDGLASATGGGPSALLVQVDDEGRAVSFTLFVLHADTGGTTVLMPPSTMVEIPGFGLERLSRAVELGGVELAGLTLSNLLSTEFDHVEVVGPNDLAALARVLGPLPVDNPSRLDTADDSGRIEVLWPAGPVDVEPGAAAQFLAQRALQETDLERMVRHQRYWDAFLDARRGIVGVVTDPQRDLEAFLDEAAIRADDIDFRILPVETIGGPEELYGVDAGGLSDLLRIVAPARLADDGDRVRVQLLNGVGTPGLAEPVTALLLPTGAVVQLTGNALEFDYRVTQVVYYRDEHLASALRIQEELGVGEVVKQRDPIDVVDVTVVIGQDLAALVG